MQVFTAIKLRQNSLSCWMYRPERVGVRRIKAFDSPHPNLLPEGEGIALNST